MSQQADENHPWFSLGTFPVPRRWQADACANQLSC